MSARDDLAAALTATGLVDVTPGYRQSMRPGDGLIRWAGRERDESGLGRIDTWEAWIALPQNMRDAEAWVEGNLGALIDALETEATVTEAAPAELLLGSNAVNGLIITAARAADQ